jgi:hypothetical protein
MRQDPWRGSTDPGTRYKAPQGHSGETIFITAVSRRDYGKLQMWDLMDEAKESIAVKPKLPDAIGRCSARGYPLASISHKSKYGYSMSIFTIPMIKPEQKRVRCQIKAHGHS